jgi:6-phosphogluconate dehydrogenase
MQNSNIGIYGLGVMGKNIALNIANKGFLVSVCNRNEGEECNIVQDFITTERQSNIEGYANIEEFVLSLEKPRKVLIMITAGLAVDEIILQLMKYMDPDDIIIDGGNSNYLDTQKRADKYNIRYLGCGISGGWYGALNGPSMMLGGSSSAWLEVQNLFESIASKREDGSACCDWFGKGGAGHFIKMIHNGIEYAMMQSIAESYDMLREISLMPNNSISSLFKEWNSQELNSYLMKASSEVLLVKDKEESLIDNVIDKSGQKGTGIDFSICALKHGVPTPTISAATNARFISSSEYRNAHNHQKTIKNSNNIKKILFDSIYCSYVVAFFQGMGLIQRVSDANSWNVSLGEVASVWEEGCIVKSSIFRKLSKDLEPKLSVQMLLEESIKTRFESLSKAVVLGVENRIPVPVFSSSLNYYYSLLADSLPANLIQLQREYFGSHGFEKIKNPGQLYHLTREL